MSNISNWIDAHARFTPNKLAVIDQQHQYTYANLADAISTNARMLKHTLRVGRGDRVAYLGFNGVEFISLMFACARLGALARRHLGHLHVPLFWLALAVRRPPGWCRDGR